ncbi:hypothetical protein R1sor_025845 [Riccia sorocarpa]|uniref:Uncharacterized protein n=1 Tax=Riccia sorocarpa TaxID=122646 RepID=A0ABD3GBD4_9MARC
MSHTGYHVKTSMNSFKQGIREGRQGFSGSAEEDYVRPGEAGLGIRPGQEGLGIRTDPPQGSACTTTQAWTGRTPAPTPDLKPSWGPGPGSQTRPWRCEVDTFSESPIRIPNPILALGRRYLLRVPDPDPKPGPGAVKSIHFSESPIRIPNPILALGSRYLLGVPDPDPRPDPGAKSRYLFGVPDPDPKPDADARSLIPFSGVCLYHNTGLDKRDSG